ncbi:unnamed protein product [Brachionus calyciflorus]|uniref:Uncharacterized protein n=1 Tax=Brachionus calyciflorus TaxID=104777 RepID=A0A813XLN8_9BILA|nr:unnamed protein product [Brachionus calyciflorus]
MLKTSLLRRCLQKNINNLKYFNNQTFNSQKSGDNLEKSFENEEETTHTSVDKSNRDFLQRLYTKPKPMRNKPFIKSLFKGEYIYDYLKFPEYEHPTLADNIEKQADSVKTYFQNTNYSKIIDKNGQFSLDALNNFRNLNLFSNFLPNEYNGSELDSIGFAKILENLAIYPSLGLGLIYNNELAAKAILTYGTLEQKNKFLPQISRGEISAGFCFSEANSSVDVSRFELRARPDFVNDKKNYVLNGQKTWVSLLANDNLDAVFITFAKTENDNGENSLNAFLIPKNTPGVSIEKVLDNKNGLNLYEINFREVKVSQENLLGANGNGFEISTKMLENSRHLIGAICTGLLKDLYRETIEFAIKTRRFGKGLSELPLVKDRIATIEQKLYTMESMTFLTAGICDSYQMPDIGSESALTKIYCTESLKECISHCLDIMAMGQFKTLDKIQQKYLSDVNYLINALNTNDVLRLYVSTNGLVLAGVEFGEELTKVRNPLKYPGFILKQIFINHKLVRSATKKIPEYFYLWEHVHPSLKEPVGLLEQSAVKFMMAAKSAMINHGREIVESQVPLAMLADMCMHIYAMNSVLARASRSYSIGLPNSQHELALAFVQCQESSRLIDYLHADIIKSRGGEGLDNTKFNIADRVFKFKDHAATHSEMIEIEADILRGSCTPVYFVGEEIKCEVKFKCVPKSGVKKTSEKKENLLKTSESMFSILSNQSQSSTSSLPATPLFEQKNFLKNFSQANENEEEFTIVWACAQIDCNCFFDESKVMLPKDPLRYSTAEKAGDNSSTSFQPNKDRIGVSIFSSKPKILFCNLVLRPGEEKSFIYTEKLPYDLAPTFRGQFARYTYKLTIGAQKLNQNTQLLKLPFRVFSLMDFEKYIPKMSDFDNEYDYTEKRNSIISISESAHNDTDSFDSSSVVPNPFKIDERSGYEELEYALQVLEDLTARMNVSHFNVANQDGKVVKITMNKTNYKIGDKIIGFLDFSEAQVPCVEFKVTLQSEEIISEECRKKPSQYLSSIHSHVELKEHCLFLKKSDFTIQVPIAITPTFVSDMVSLRWRLHFDFALSKVPLQNIHRSSDPAISVSWRPPNSLPIEITSWDLPIVLHPFDPFVASDLIYSNNPECTNTLVLN